MKIVILVEGNTERAFLPALRRFLKERLAGNMPRLDPAPYDGRLAKRDKLKRDVERHLLAADAVGALTDAYTADHHFPDASDAKGKMREWVGPNERFFAHAAQYEFEAWLLPYWAYIRHVA